ncbi:type III-B CRISPR module-associated protein Cmr5 [Sphaerospermopsis sp. FACHB-1094]|uniref:type III-B CRISPR module-associated protein Cmr5 n=1 Tax=Sphaerospermopsis sp. FACHB-1094 TaxID=2692861 RepID=UPI001687AB49|nr:type III-B CRISPR module-associated protein Cmr5 [Sphaerospermopsis sp. FACHB-1094]MBD2132625.1 type III-B CRISPR module-associated protein Cmr5 [Sphaerospermopsis sp. FACHB-1094]
MSDEIKYNPPILKPKPTAKTEIITAPPSTISSSSFTAAPSTSTKPKEIDRDRAALAWDKICQVKKNPSENFQKKYGSLARKMPTLIQVNGLAQTLAFLKAKAKENDHQILMFKNLSEWILNRFNLGTGDLLSDHILKMDSQRYRLITNESLAFLQWLKRFAEAELGTEENN